MIIDFNKPKKVRSTAEHNQMHMSDSGVDGTYVPNMSQEDANKWKGKYVGGDYRRVEVRKNITFKRNAYYDKNHFAQVLIIVREPLEDRAPLVTISCNGKIAMSAEIFDQFENVIEEAKMILCFSPEDAKAYIDGSLV